MTKLSDIYPLTIVKDRYNGTYSGGSWTAWNMDFYEIPQQIQGDDITCGCWWDGFNEDRVETQNEFNKKVYIGKGNTPEQAVEDLIKAIEYKNGA